MVVQGLERCAGVRCGGARRVAADGHAAVEFAAQRLQRGRHGRLVGRPQAQRHAAEGRQRAVLCQLSAHRLGTI